MREAATEITMMLIVAIFLIMCFIYSLFDPYPPA